MSTNQKCNYRKLCTNKVQEGYKRCQECNMKANNCRKKYLDKLKETRPEKYQEITDKKNEINREYLRKKRQDPEFKKREQEYQKEYCERKGISKEDLWYEIRSNRQ